MHPRHMHDLKSLTLEDAIERHGGEAEQERDRFGRLSAAEAIPFLLGLTAVALDGVFQRQRLEIVHMPGMHAQSPEGTVRSLLAVSSGGFWTMPSPVPMSWS